MRRKLQSSNLNLPNMHHPWKTKAEGYEITIDRESVAGSVIQATGTVEFEDGLRTEVLQEDC